MHRDAASHLPLLFESICVKSHLSILGLFLVLTGAAAPSIAAATESTSAPRDTSQLHIASGSAMLVDLQTNKIIYASNPDVVVPIASVSKLMTAMVVLDAKLPMNEYIAVNISDTPEMKGVFSRVKLGSELTRHDMMLITLMSSENRAAATLAHHYPGGYVAFIAAMNAKAKSLGMMHTRYVEPTGLSMHNVSTARDLSKLLAAARQYPMLSQLSTTKEKTVAFRKPNYTLGFRNTDHLVNKDKWNIKITKTGFTNQAGHCLVLVTEMGNRPVSLVILDAFGKYTHFADASRIRSWIETGKSGSVPDVALRYKADKNLKARPAAQPHPSK
ncbi:D-alanyl-D-alanine endopeptidase [Pseudomonas lundensis]|jgi:serine-type D-Ala-D-Ala endopeptidase (penicillin-binding protein 7)|uniref:D-alanyl-D-alanine endopeptidase n=1 Tax=Pseudomonas lundensis TaxID=86185 RepID=A0ABX4GHJ0_9PSED|nr:D-alanyl-D-alanine endopeptidase [Pseudomonas lundensis]MBM1182386.1 D-alanyl-D-alanine endopeptidase [Pseudomonas lundensis]NMZ54107.1 D-alanyl-D-alanine endopeptidase [Pseudomonas lundensis]NMZ99379.1 D-alanyl-D-alanine endopeptidase [Pseudomonas lundensis]NNA13318.1 D-alanyl-D-alanine endopeptidase [Pseudomonas lundensis]NNA27541.1 D-alanyl-D-alanine endopeptidase [Pseudomonas lundensis]